MKKYIMNLAWTLTRTNGAKFSYALSRAWKVGKLVSSLASATMRGVVFHYRKEDGSIRRAVGMANNWLLDLHGLPELHNTGAVVVRYYDIEAGAVRSFRSDRLILA